MDFGLPQEGPFHHGPELQLQCEGPGPAETGTCPSACSAPRGTFLTPSLCPEHLSLHRGSGPKAPGSPLRVPRAVIMRPWWTSWLSWTCHVHSLEFNLNTCICHVWEPHSLPGHFALEPTGRDSASSLPLPEQPSETSASPRARHCTPGYRCLGLYHLSITSWSTDAGPGNFDELLEGSTRLPTRRRPGQQSVEGVPEAETDGCHSAHDPACKAPQKLCTSLRVSAVRGGGS